MMSFAEIDDAYNRYIQCKLNEKPTEEAWTLANVPNYMDSEDAVIEAEKEIAKKEKWKERYKDVIERMTMGRMTDPNIDSRFRAFAIVQMFRDIDGI